MTQFFFFNLGTPSQSNLIVVLLLFFLLPNLFQRNCILLYALLVRMTVKPTTWLEILLKFTLLPTINMNTSTPCCSQVTHSTRHRFDVTGDTNYAKYFDTRIVLTTNATDPISVDFYAYELHALARYEVGISALILIFLYVLIILEVVHRYKLIRWVFTWTLRTLAAMICAFVALGVLSVFHERPTFPQVSAEITHFQLTPTGYCLNWLWNCWIALWNDDHGRYLIYYRSVDGVSLLTLH